MATVIDTAAPRGVGIDAGGYWARFEGTDWINVSLEQFALVQWAFQFGTMLIEFDSPVEGDMEVDPPVMSQPATMNWCRVNFPDPE